MATRIIAVPNQSLLDVIVQSTGSLEAAFQFCRDNDVALSDIPAEGTVYVVSDAALALGDKGVLSYLAKNNIVVGTLNNAGGLLNDDGVTLLLNDDGQVLQAD